MYLFLIPDSLVRLEIVYWFHYVDDIHRVANDIDDVCQRLVGHWCLVQSLGIYGGGVDTGRYLPSL